MSLTSRVSLASSSPYRIHAAFSFARREFYQLYHQQHVADATAISDTAADTAIVSRHGTPCVGGSSVIVAPFSWVVSKFGFSFPSLCSLSCVGPLYVYSSQSTRSNASLSSPLAAGSSRPKATPLYPGLSRRPAQPRSRTPLPAPAGFGGRERARQKFSQTANFPNDTQTPTLEMFEKQDGATTAVNKSTRVVNSHRTGNYYHNNFTQPTVVYDPQLPSPIVIVHSAARETLSNKTNAERKHRGTSRNVLGGFYTS